MGLCLTRFAATPSTTQQMGVVIGRGYRFLTAKECRRMHVSRCGCINTVSVRASRVVAAGVFVVEPNVGTML